jgi:phosphonate transport system substrate-binding protein
MKNSFWQLSLLIIIFSWVTLVASCGDRGSVFAGQRLQIVLVPEQNIYQQRQRYGVIAGYLSKHLDKDVRITVMPTYGKVCDAFLEGKADVGFFGSFSYVLTRAKAGVEPLARPVWLDGSSTYSGYIFVRKDSGIRSVKDMKNKRLALVDKATTAGYIFQQAYFKKQGIDRMAEYFREIHFAGSHDAAAWAVYTGEADVGGAKNHIFNALGKEYPDFYDKMLILARSSDVPSNGMVVRADLDAHLKARLKELLLGLNDSPEGRLVLKEFGAMSFIENRDEDYSSLYKMVAELGLDLATYQY